MTPRDTQASGKSASPDQGPMRRRKIRFSWIDVVVIGTICGVVAYLVHRVDTVLEYNWQWSIIPGYFFFYDEEQARWVANLLVQGFLVTLRLSLWSLVFAAAIGIVMGLCRISGNLFLRMVSRAYVELIRNIPPLVFIFIFYFFISGQIMPILGADDLALTAAPLTLTAVDVLLGPPELFSNLLSGLICLALFEGAYITEIVRAGVQSIEKGQWEAADSIGLTKLQRMRYVVMPQALRNIAPPLANQFITLVKDSSIVSLISVQELTFLAVEVAASTTRVFEIWITVGAMYFVLCYACSLAFARMEKRMAAGRR